MQTVIKRIKYAKQIKAQKICHKKFFFYQKADQKHYKA